MDRLDDVALGDILAHGDDGSAVVVGIAADAVEVLHPAVGGMRISRTDAKLLLPARAAPMIETAPNPWPVVRRAVPGIAIWTFARSEPLAQAAVRYWRRTKRREDIALLAAAIRRFGAPSGTSLADLVLGGAAARVTVIEKGVGGALSLRRTDRADVIEFIELFDKQMAAIDELWKVIAQARMTPRQVYEVGLYLISQPGYQNRCWDCTGGVHSSVNPRCPSCGWLVCGCGACKDGGTCERYRRRVRSEDLGNLAF